ncbi:prealbumin-like fold domain-containing protein [Corynebacterium sp. MNWGS58]|uniref:prealbumin-like fold domain-containing protein n=1 Tax=Corynebacterium sp. 102791.4 TaxID=3104612 RepID=UPI003514AF77
MDHQALLASVRYALVTSASLLIAIAVTVGVTGLVSPQKARAEDTVEEAQITEAESPDESAVESTVEPGALVPAEEPSPVNTDTELPVESLPDFGEEGNAGQPRGAGAEMDDGLEWFAAPIAGERRLDMSPARFFYNRGRGGVTSLVQGLKAQRELKVKRIRIAFTRTDAQDNRILEVNGARFSKNREVCRGRNVTTERFGNKVIEFDVSRCGINIWEGSNDELRVENISLSGGGNVPPDAFAMNVWVDDVFDHGDPREWNKDVENGKLTTIIEPEDRLENSHVLMTRTITQDAKISGPFIARVQNQNGFDVDGGQAPAELRIIGPDGREIFSKQINANAGHAAAVEGGNGWGGIDFKEQREFTVPASSRVEVDMYLHGRNKHGRNLKEPNKRSPLGPGALEFRTEILEQRRQLCVQPDKTASVTGFRLSAKKNISGTISGVQSLRFGTGNEAEEITARYETNIDGLQLSGTFATAVTQPTGGQGAEGSPKPFCVDFSFNADRTVPENEVEKYFGLELDYALIQFEARAFDYDERDSENKTTLVGAKFAVYAAKSADDPAAGEHADQPDWDKRVWSSDQAETAMLTPGIYYLVEEQTPQTTRPTLQAQVDAQDYSLLPGPIRFELTYGEGSNNGFGINVPSSAEAPFVLSARVEDGRAIMDIGNITRGEMPLTGGRGVWGCVVAGLLLLAVGGLATQRRRQA